VTFAALDVEALNSPSFEFRFRSDFKSAFAAAAAVAEYRVSILGYAAGSARVSSVIYFAPSQATIRDSFARVLATDPASVFASTDLASYGLITATVVLDSPPPPLPSPGPPSSPPRSPPKTSSELALPPTLPPQSSPPPPRPSLSISPQQSPAANGDVAAVAGAGAGGGVLAVAAAATVWWLVRRGRKRRKQQMDEQAKMSDMVGEAATSQGTKVLKDSAEDYEQASLLKQAKRAQAETVVHADTVEMVVHDVELEGHPVALVDPRGGVEEERVQWRDARLKLDGAHQLEWSELELTKAVGVCLCR
jgi:hypothetical protein